MGSSQTQFNGDYNLTKLQSYVQEEMARINKKLNYLIKQDLDKSFNINLITYNQIEGQTLWRIMKIDIKLILVLGVITGAVDTKVFLPEASSIPGRIVILKKRSNTAGNIVIQENVDGTTPLTISTYNTYAAIYSNGINFLRIG